MRSSTTFDPLCKNCAPPFFEMHSHFPSFTSRRNQDPTYAFLSPTPGNESITCKLIEDISPLTNDITLCNHFLYMPPPRTHAIIQSPTWVLSRDVRPQPICIITPTTRQPCRPPLLSRFSGRPHPYLSLNPWPVETQALSKFHHGCHPNPNWNYYLPSSKLYNLPSLIRFSNR